jgi:hypothetical protein
MDGLTGRGDAEKVAAMGAVVDLVCGDDVAVDGLPMNLGSEVGKRVAQPAVENTNTGFVGRGAGLGGVVDKVVGEQFIKKGEIALALDLFGVAADDRLEGLPFTAGRRGHVGGIWMGHFLPAFLSTPIRTTPC